mgnify:CR=1 FL=1
MCGTLFLNMEYLPIKTRIMQPPKDDLFALFDGYLIDVREEDIVLVSSKIVAIGEGRCLPIEGNNKQKLVEHEADVLIHREYWGVPMTIKQSTFLGNAGIDESNSNGYYTLLPQDMFDSAKQIQAYLKKKHNIEKVGVIITDSHSQALRYGATGIGLAFWGIEPLQDHVGRKDLFGRSILFEKSNLIDGLASGATVVGGEVNECQPIVIARGVPQVVFTEGNLQEQLFVRPEKDMFRVLYERYLKR